MHFRARSGPDSAKPALDRETLEFAEQLRGEVAEAQKALAAFTATLGCATIVTHHDC